MSKVEISETDVESAFCQMVRHLVSPTNKLPHWITVNKYGVNVRPHTSDPYKFQMRFVSIDDLLIEFEVDMKRLQDEGKKYVEGWMVLLLEQMKLALKERQEDATISIGKLETPFEPVMKQTAIAHNAAVADPLPRTVH